MLAEETIAELGAELAQADRDHTVIERITARYPDATVADAYEIQARWRARREAEGHRVVGHKIGLTSKAMQLATGITEPDYGVMFDDTVVFSGSTIYLDQFSNARVEVELAFRLRTALNGPTCTVDDVLAATEHVIPALEVLNSHIELQGRTIVDTISDNAAYGAMVLGDSQHALADIDLPWVPGVLRKNGVVEETGVAAGVLGHPAEGVAWLANKLHRHGEMLDAGEIVLSGSFTRPVWVGPGDSIVVEFGPLGEVRCHFA
jgi:2-oxo-hept-3-ene-1,7-dioate hydratase